MNVSRLIARALLAVVIVAAPVAAQKHPDFTGTWVEDVAQRKVVPADPPVVKSPVQMEDPPQVITQSAQTITIAQTFMGDTTRITYDLDGRENKTRQGAQVRTTRTRWDGNRLITEGTNFQTTSAGEESWQRREVRWLTPKGEMALEVTQIDEDGKSRAVLQVFRKRN